MWLMLPTGAVSIVSRIHAGDEYNELELVVRARQRAWLDAFREWCPGMTETVHSDGTKDYQYRAYVSRYDLARALARLALDGVTYNNFKSATMSARHGLKDRKARLDLHDAYVTVWNTMLKAGDGTSMYDYKTWGHLKGIEACRRWGHWWPSADDRTCRDCGEPNPNPDGPGPEHSYPPKTPKRNTNRKVTT